MHDQLQKARRDNSKLDFDKLIALNLYLKYGINADYDFEQWYIQQFIDDFYLKYGNTMSKL